MPGRGSHGKEQQAGSRSCEWSLTANKKMETSVLQPQKMNFTNNLRNPGSRSFPSESLITQQQ